MKNWIGRSLIGISIIHTTVAVLAFGNVVHSIFQRGVFNTVGTDPATAAVAWSVLFGAMLFVCGLAVSTLERTSPGMLPKRLGWSLLVPVTLGVVLMPASGFWLALPPAIAILAGKRGARSAAKG